MELVGRLRQDDDAFQYVLCWRGWSPPKFLLTQGVLHFYAAHYSDILHVFGDKQGFGKVQISNMEILCQRQRRAARLIFEKMPTNARTARTPSR